MKKKFALLTGFILVSMYTFCCTTFLLARDGKYLFGRNYDWVTGSGVVFTNQRGLAKTSSPDKDGTTIQWVSRFGSITFNQYGKEFPTGGMNEQGLVVELMWLDGTKYPAADNRPAIDVLQWIQYQLDNSATIDDVIASDKKVRIGNGNVPLHYLVADANGNAATIEFLDGKMVVHKGSDLPFPVLTNDTYSYSLNETKSAIRSSGNPARSFTNNSIDRFAKACSMVQQFAEMPASQDAKTYAFGILDAVAQGTHTKWSIVYDITNRTVSFKTLGYNTVKLVSFTAFDFSCNQSSLSWNMNQSGEGNISRNFIPVTIEINRQLVENSFRESESQVQAPENVIREAWSYFSRISCH